MTPAGGEPPAADMPLDADERLQRALDIACAYVNRRERTVAEVRAQLERKGIAEAPAERAVEVLVHDRLVDDERFAELFVTDKRELEQWGAERIRRGLRARGIDRALAERALNGAPPGADGGADVNDAEPASELDRALAVLRRRFPEPPRERRDRDRALGVLLRKGYEPELAVDALNAHGRDA